MPPEPPSSHASPIGPGMALHLPRHWNGVARSAQVPTDAAPEDRSAATVTAATRELRAVTLAACAAWPSGPARDEALSALREALHGYLAAFADAGIRGPLARNGAILTVRSAAARADTRAASAVVGEAEAIIAQA
jgi:hypothetical protein